MIYLIAYLIIGGFAGLMSGLLGIGGGIIVVPSFAFLFKLHHIVPLDAIMQVAAGSSLAIIVFTSLVALRVHYQLGEINWAIYFKLWPGLALGAILGALFAQSVPTHALKITFGLFLIGILIKMLLDLRAKKQPPSQPTSSFNQVITTSIGFISGLLGLGGGVLTVPYLHHCGLMMRQVTPISNLCTLTVGAVGSVMFIISGYHQMLSIDYATGYVYWPAVLGVLISSMLITPLGVKLNYRLPQMHLKILFMVLLAITALKMVTS